MTEVELGTAAEHALIAVMRLDRQFWEAAKSHRAFGGETAKKFVAVTESNP